jgi:hypothetical protein
LVQASVFVPPIFINRMCALTTYVLTKRSSLPISRIRWASTISGLLLIPLIVLPIDHSITWGMKNGFEPLANKYWPAVKPTSDTTTTTQSA